MSDQEDEKTLVLWQITSTIDQPTTSNGFKIGEKDFNLFIAPNAENTHLGIRLKPSADLGEPTPPLNFRLFFAFYNATDEKEVFYREYTQKVFSVDQPEGVGTDDFYAFADIANTYFWVGLICPTSGRKGDTDLIASDLSIGGPAVLYSQFHDEEMEESDLGFVDKISEFFFKMGGDGDESEEAACCVVS